MEWHLWIEKVGRKKIIHERFFISVDGKNYVVFAKDGKIVEMRQIRPCYDL